ncbi:MAG: hypothetical protein MUQ75_02145 [Crocinitomicaceae bacterium]|jgi:hypothetical protein|nr:hypothetical protein [Crocinitomicaceae bacterium]
MAEEEMAMMGDQPPMESQMQMGAEQEAKQKIMNSSKTVASVLMSRLMEMSPSELQMLDKAITPDVASVLIKLLPELKDIIEAVEQGGVADAMPEDQMMDDGMPEEMGALGNI